VTKGVVACVAALAIGQASANTIYTLTNPNSGLGADPGPYATVDVGLVGTTATIIFTGLSSGGDTYKLGDVGVNVAGSFSYPSGQTYTSGSGHEDGFGDFNLVINGPNGSSSAVASISFTITGSWLSDNSVLTPNAGGSVAVAHIYPFGPTGAPLNTGYAGNGTTTDVPDGGTTALLLGASVTGIALIRRKLS